MTRVATGFAIRLDRDERALVSRLMGELRELVTAGAEPGGPGAPLTARLFPVVHPDHPDREEEYQRLMRDELVASRLSGIETVQDVLARPGRRLTLDEGELLAFMQAVNAVRLVLGTMLDLDDQADDEPGDEEPGDDGPGDEESLAGRPEYQLYGYLSWLLDAAVHALSN